MNVKAALSFCHTGLGHRTQVIRLGNKNTYALSDLTGPQDTF